LPTDLRERILDEALELMSEQGAAATSMRQLAGACGVRVAALYHYFESKDALLAAVIAERNYGRRLAQSLDLRVDRSASAEQRLRAVFTEMWDGALEEESVWRLLLGEGIRSEPAALPVGRDLLATVLPGVEVFVREWVPELDDPGAAAEVLVSQMFLGFIRHMFDPEADAAQLGRERADVLVRVLLG
jgi:AcrR family transcriptional regulator